MKGSLISLFSISASQLHLSLFQTDKITCNENTTYFSEYTQVCYSHVLSLELSIKTIPMQALFSEELSH